MKIAVGSSMWPNQPSLWPSLILSIDEVYMIPIIFLLLSTFSELLN